MENTYRDVNIALANEFAMVAEALGVDAIQAIEIANAHPRVAILRPGVGVGGHCIPVDPWFLAEVDPAHTELVATARRINDSMPLRTAARIREIVADLPDPEIVIIGMAYKPETDDLRDSPALRIAELLRKDGYRIRQFDPLVPSHGYESLARAAKGSDLLAILVPHRVVVEDFRANEVTVKAAMRTPRAIVF